MTFCDVTPCSSVKSTHLSEEECTASVMMVEEYNSPPASAEVK
jgi:hypothetical protein